MTPLRVAIDARHIRDFGIGTYIRNLLIGLAAVDQSDSYYVICHAGDEQEFAHLPERFQRTVYARGDNDPVDNLAFPSFLKRLGADVYHIPLMRVPMWMPQPYVVTVHDLSRLLFDESSRLRRQLSMYRSRRGLMRAAKVIVVSAATRRDVEHYLGVPREMMRQIYNAPDPRFLRQASADPAAEEQQRRLALERYQIQVPFILYAGNIRPQKNIPRLIEAFAVLRSELENHESFGRLRLVIIGDEISRYPGVRLATIRSRVEDAVRFLGFVPLETLRVLYRAASAFAFPSLYEGFGLPPLEAMASGTPVVTSNVSSLPEVVGEAALTVNPENLFEIARALRDVLVDERLRSSLIRKGYQQVQRFSWERTAEQVHATYHDVVQAQRSKR